MNSARKNNIGQSNAIGKYIAEGGLLFIFINIVPIVYVTIKSLRKKEYYYFIASIIFLILICTTNIPYQLVTILFLSIFYDKIYNYKFDKCKREKKEEHV